MLRFCRVFTVACLSGFATIGSAESNWSINAGDDPESYQSFLSLDQASADTIKDEYATKDVIPVLSLRCAPGNAEILARIDWRRFISSFNTEVGFKVDGGPVLWQKWGVDRSNRITRSKSAADSQKLVDLLLSGNELTVEVTPYAESPLTVHFGLAGLSQGLESLRVACQ